MEQGFFQKPLHLVKGQNKTLKEHVPCPQDIWEHLRDLIPSRMAF